MNLNPILLATSNQGKRDEYSTLLSLVGIRSITLANLKLKPISVTESGDTFEANALLKAKAYAKSSGFTTLADDTGLSVHALQGRPGLLSRRYGHNDQTRINKLLNELKHVPKSNRQAYFETAIVLYDPSVKEYLSSNGRVDGVITTKPLGTHGFGFDPIFYSPEIDKTFGQATLAEKDMVSHRSRALVNLLHLMNTTAAFQSL